MKVEKLKITGYESLADLKSDTTTGSIVVAANPDSVTINFKADTEKGKDTGTYSGGTNFSFLLDGTGAVYDSDYTVDQQVDYLKKLVIAYDKDKKSSAYVKIEWGMVFSGIGAGDSTSTQKNYFKGKVKSVAINYSLFSSTGIPLRAIVTLSVEQAVDLSSSGGMTQAIDFTKAVAEQDLTSLKESFKSKLAEAFANAKDTKSPSVRFTFKVEK